MIKGKFPEIPRFYRTKRDPPAVHRKEAGFGQRYDDDHVTDKKDDHVTDEDVKNDDKDLNHLLVKILDSFQNLDLKQLRLLLVNLHSQINSYRPIQAKQLLLMHMHQQIQHKKELIATLKLRIEQASIYLKKT